MHSQRCITARANTARLPEGAAAQDVRPLCCIQLYDDIRLLAARAADRQVRLICVCVQSTRGGMPS